MVNLLGVLGFNDLFLKQFPIVKWVVVSGMGVVRSFSPRGVWGHAPLA